MKAADKLKKILEDKGWSQSKLARVAGLKQRTVSYIISRGRDPGIHAGLAIASATEVPAWWLWDDEADPPAPDSKTGGLTLQNMPESALMEEVLRRKRFAREAFETLLGRYKTIRDHYRRILTVGGSGKPSDDADEFSRNLWTGFMDAAHSYFYTYEAWRAYEERWYQINFLGRLDEPEGLEMFKSMETLSQGGPIEQVMNSIKSVLRSWAGKGAARDTIDRVAKDLYVSQERSSYLADKSVGQERGDKPKALKRQKKK